MFGLQNSGHIRPALRDALGANDPTAYQRVISSLRCTGMAPREGRMAIHIRRREVITALGGAAVAWPLAAHAQQQPAIPVIGLLDQRSPDELAARLRGFRQGLKD